MQDKEITSYLFKVSICKRTSEAGSSNSTKRVKRPPPHIDTYKWHKCKNGKRKVFIKCYINNLKMTKPTKKSSYRSPT